MFYDPMIAKLVTHAPTRAQAIELQADALDAFYIDGINHNIPFLTALMQHPRWCNAELSTGFIAEEYPDGFVPREAAGEELKVMAAVAAAIDHANNIRRREISQQMDGKRVRFAEDRVVWLGEARQDVHVESNLVNHEAGDHVTVSILKPDGSVSEILELASDWWPGNPIWSGTVGDRTVNLQVRSILNGYDLAYRGIRVPVRVYTRREAELAALMPEKVAADMSKYLLCPMPGLVKAIHVDVDQEVKAGDPLAVVEAMKMENILRAERDGKVSKVNAKPGDSLAVDEVILEFA